MQKGIVEMLTSRLSSNSVSVADPITTAQAVDGIKEITGDDSALIVGAKLKANYVIYGSITVIGDSVSIDAKMINMTGSRAPLHFHKHTPHMNKVISQINRMAIEINAQVLRRQAPSVAAGPLPAQTPPTESLPTNVRAHPEKLLQSGIAADSDRTLSSEQEKTLNPAFVPLQRHAADQTAFWKSRHYAHVINGLAVGDVNNDGFIESVVVTPNEVLVYQTVQNRMRKIAAVDSPRFTLNISVDIADINQNGTAEIFVTAYNNQRDTLASYVLEFNGTAFKTIVTKTRLYFRVIDQPGGRPMLLGQKQQLDTLPHFAPIMEVKWQGNEYIETHKRLPGSKANLLGVALLRKGNNHDGADQVVALDPGDRLLLMERSGQKLWTSKVCYGGTHLYYALSPDAPGGADYRSAFLPVRVRTLDLNSDGQPEVIVPQNSDRTKRKLSEHRFFKESSIMVLSWDGQGLTPSRQTQSLKGRIQDIAVADFDNDGTIEMVAAMVTQDPSVLKKAKSVLIAFELKGS